MEPNDTPTTAKPKEGGTWQVSMRRPSLQRGGFTLLEALIASVIVAMVAATASMSVAVGTAVEQQNRLSVLAMQAAELQMGSVLEQSYDTMYTLAGAEARGAMLGPKRPGASTRTALPSAFADLARTTTVTAENRNFTQYNNYTVTGMRIEVTVTGPDGSTLARLVRFRGKDPTS
jgi:prepilin-type N-terminal cleavage/methylation domain-containing protein